MELKNFDKDVDVIAQLGDQPNLENGLSAQELKEKFDVAANLIKKYLNTDVVPAVNEKLPSSRLPGAIDAALAQAKASGVFDGVSVTHRWDGTVLEVTSASGTSSADLKGAKGDKGDQGAPGKDGTDIVACSYAYAVLPAGRAKGDVNGDGVVDAKDSELIRSYRAGTATIDDEISLWAAEIDGNGKVDAYDAYLIDVHQNGGAVLTQFAADYYNNWHYDTEDRFYYYDIAVAGMTAGCGATVIPSVSFGPGFMKAVTMDGFMRLCFQACPTQDILCRILYGGNMEGVTVENGVENSFLDAGAMKTQEIVNEVLAALPTWDGGMY